MAVSAQDRAILASLEQRLTEYPAEAVEALLADDFVEFGASGRQYNKTEALAALQQRREKIAIADFAVRDLGCDAVLTTYRTLHCDGQGGERQVLRSSLWRRKEEGWEVVFHQGTPINID